MSEPIWNEDYPDLDTATWTAFKRNDGTWGLKIDWLRGSSGANRIEARDEASAQLVAHALNSLGHAKALADALTPFHEWIKRTEMPIMACIRQEEWTAVFTAMKLAGRK